MLSPSAHVRWRTQLTGIQHYAKVNVDVSSPVLSGTSAYVTSIVNANDQTDGEATLYDVNTDTGKLLWKVPLSIRNAAQPMTDGSRVYLGGASGVVAIDARSGALEWQFAGPSGSEFGPLTESGGTLLGSNAGTVYAFDPLTGALRWSHQLSETHNGIMAWVSAIGQSVYAADDAGYLYSLALATGDQQWVQNPPNNAEWFGVSGKNGLLLAQAQADTPVNGNATTDLSGGELDRIDPATGTPMWNAPVPLDRSYKVAVSNSVAVAIGDNEGLFGIKLSDGSIAWQHKGLVSPSQATTQDGVAYTINEFNASTTSLAVLKVNTGAEMFALPLPGFDVGPYGGFYPSIPTPGNRAVYITNPSGQLIKVS